MRTYYKNSCLLSQCVGSSNSTGSVLLSSVYHPRVHKALQEGCVSTPNVNHFLRLSVIINELMLYVRVQQVNVLVECYKKCVKDASMFFIIEAIFKRSRTRYVYFKCLNYFIRMNVWFFLILVEKL